MMLVAQYGPELGTNCLHDWYVVIDTSLAKEGASESDVEAWLQAHSQVDAFMDGDDSHAGAEAEARRLQSLTPDGWVVHFARPIIAEA